MSLLLSPCDLPTLYYIVITPQKSRLPLRVTEDCAGFTSGLRGGYFVAGFVFKRNLWNKKDYPLTEVCTKDTGETKFHRDNHRPHHHHHRRR